METEQKRSPPISWRASGNDWYLFLYSLASLPARKSPKKNKVKGSWSSDCGRLRSPLWQPFQETCIQMMLGGSKGKRCCWRVSPDLQPHLTFEPWGYFWQEMKLCLRDGLAPKHIASPPCASLLLTGSTASTGSLFWALSSALPGVKRFCS